MKEKEFEFGFAPKQEQEYRYERLGSAARMRASKYDVLREVWKSVAVPWYGMDVIAWNESEIDRLEVGQNRVARMALNAPSM